MGDTSPRKLGNDRRTGEWPLMLVLGVLLLTGFSALAPVLRGSAWWWVMAMMVVATLTALAALRHVGVPRALVPWAGLGVIALVLTLFFGQGTGLLWLIPTPATVSVLSVLTEQGVRSINEQTTPAVLTEGIVLLLTAGAGVLAWLVHLVAVTLRVPAVAGLAVLLPVLIPGLVLEEGVGMVSLLLVAAAYLWLLRIDVRLQQRRGRVAAAATARGPMRPGEFTPGRGAPYDWVPGPWGGPGSGGGSLVLGGVTLVAALTLSLVVPTMAVNSVGSGPGALFGGGVSPMIDLGQDLRRPEAGPALHYVTTADNRPYLTLLTLDRFEGTTWTSDEDIVNRANTVDSIDRPAGLGRDVATVDVSSSIVIDGVRSPLLPLPMPATRINGLAGDWYWDTETLNVKGENATTQGQTYTVSGLEVAPTAEQLRTSSRDYPAEAASNLELPGERPAIIDETALAVTEGNASAYDSAVALQDYLNGADFRYDTEAPVADDYDGGGLDVVGTFLEVKSGYCVHFSSAMAVMARALGIPARISIGYLPGTRTFTQGIETFEVDSHDLHAWPELYFVGIGWVPFEPTPGRGVVPEYAQSSAIPEPTTEPGATDETRAPRAQQDVPADAGSVPSETAAGVPVISAVVFWPGVILLMFGLLLLVPGLLRSWRRRRRLRRIRGGTAAGGPALGWAELTDTALDLGVRVSQTDTPRDLARRMAERMTESAERAPVEREPANRDTADQKALERVLGQIERLRFARPGAIPLGVDAAAGGVLADDVMRVVRALNNASPRVARVRAMVAPESLAGLGRRDRSATAHGQAPAGA